MKTAQKKFRSNNDQYKLKVLGDKLCDKIEDIFNHFDIDYRHNGKLYSMCCPIHNGDNQSALNIYPEGEIYRGNWKCRTHGCEEIFKGSIIGFIRGILSNQKYKWQKKGDETCTFAETIKWCEEFINLQVNDIVVSQAEKEKKKFISALSPIIQKNSDTNQKIIREHIVNSLKIPAQYYIDRGYSVDILKKYDVGLCHNPKKEMHNRVVVPVYDTEFKYMIGCTGRSIYTKCNKCDSYHIEQCPEEFNLHKHSKWKHNTGFKTQDHLYNMWFAKKYIANTGYVILVESPGNVWRLEENNIHNSVAIFGTNLSAQQKLLLDASGAMTIFVIMDNDEAGAKAAQNIYNKCHKTYKIHNILISKNDIGEMDNKEIKEEIIDKIKELI